MNELTNLKFNDSKDLTDIEEIYSYSLNFLNQLKSKNKMTNKYIAKAFDCSEAKVSLFLKGKIKDYDLLNSYAGLLGYRLILRIEKLKYSEKIHN